jgi:hypothetical protein
MTILLPLGPKFSKKEILMDNDITTIGTRISQLGNIDG